MIKGTTKNGFAFEVSEGIGNDFRVLEAIADADSADASANLRGTVALVRLLLGEKGKERLYRHLQTDSGEVPSGAVIDTVAEIVTIVKDMRPEVKN